MSPFAGFTQSEQRQTHRLPTGGRIDRDAKLPFTFDGRDYVGYGGDTLASALLAHGVRLFGRSFKYHRPRGVLAAGPEEPNALVELRAGARREPNTPATTVELFAGLQANSQNRFPSLAFDLLSINSAFAPIFAAGFYYKTFMWPAKAWERVYEPLIRRAAGLGRASGLADPDTYHQAHLHCDVLVVGGGAAGLSAALAAGRRGARVVLCEHDVVPGGRLLSEVSEVGGQAGPDWADAAAAELAAMPRVRVMPRTVVFGVYDHGVHGAIERVADHKPAPGKAEPRQCYWHIVARRTVLAAGATERALVFGGNDRPGVMLAGAVRSYLNRYAVTPARQAVMLTSGDDGWRAVADCVRHGVSVAAVVDRRSEVPEVWARLAKQAGIRVFAGGTVATTQGWHQVRMVDVIDAAGACHRIGADLVGMAGGWSPNVQLACHLGGKPVWNDGQSAFLPGRLPPGMRVAGAAAGQGSLAAALASGGQAGAAAAAELGFDGPPPERPECIGEADAPSPVWLPPGSKGKAFVDFQHDVTVSDIKLAHREGFRSVEHLKRYTTLGMATDQGRTANVNGLAIMAGLTGRSIAETGTTVFRPPYVPVAIGALAGQHRGRHFRPTRLTPGYDWAKGENASFIESGPWLRAQWFPRAGEKTWRASVDREVLATRNGVGVCDVSTLGKMEMTGVDAPVFLDRLYANSMSTLRPGRARYGLMLREDGFAMDDGTVARLSDDRFVLTTTTAQAANVLSHMEFCAQVLWPELDVQFLCVTEQWAQYALAGPHSRAVLQRFLDPGQDISEAVFPFMAAGEFRALDGVRVRLFRISFSGERAYELAVPARLGNEAIRALMRAGAGFGITPYGLEAMGVMRIEKGHPAGNELNGQTTAGDLGFGRMLAARRGDFIGRMMAQRPALMAADRPALVGLVPVNRAARLHAGAHFLAKDVSATPENDLGWVSSVAFSPLLGHTIGLGFLSGGLARVGQVVRAYDPMRGGDEPVEVVRPCFYDPEGSRLRG
jgi:sarcosine oxidase subunit alpha